MLVLTLAVQKVCSRVKCEIFSLRHYTKMLTLAALIQSAAVFFVSFIAVKRANENCAV